MSVASTSLWWWIWKIGCCGYVQYSANSPGKVVPRPLHCVFLSALGGNHAAGLVVRNQGKLDDEPDLVGVLSSLESVTGMLARAPNGVMGAKVGARNTELEPRLVGSFIPDLC